VYSLLSWAKQGVLLLNAALTVERKKPGSHSKFWSNYMIELMQETADRNKNLIWVALGKNSQEILEKIENIDPKNIVKAPHPMVAQYSGDLDSYKNIRIFTQINDKLTDNGFDKIRFNT
jgi:uracil-DNA glycosylase